MPWGLLWISWIIEATMADERLARCSPLCHRLREEACIKGRDVGSTVDIRASEHQSIRESIRPVRKRAEILLHIDGVGKNGAVR